MKRRQFLIGTVTTALTAAWTRVAGAVGIVTPSAAPDPDRYFTAGDHLDRMIRDRHRRLISDEHWSQAVKRAFNILGQQRRGEIDDVRAGAEVLAIHSRALRHPEPPREIPPLRADEVGVEEVVALLRRVIAGDAMIEVERPWKTVYHTYGCVTIDGWHLVAFRRMRGIKYVDTVTSPDGRRGTYDSFDEREGNPVALLSDDEQDQLDDVFEEAQV